MKIFLVGLAAASFLPIWRAAPDKQSLNFWEYIAYVGTEDYWGTHIKYESALMRARRAWAEHER